MNPEVLGGSRGVHGPLWDEGGVQQRYERAHGREGETRERRADDDLVRLVF